MMNNGLKMFCLNLEIQKLLLRISISIKKKGEFLNADTLVFLKYKRQYRVLCLDLSVFSIHTDEDMEDIDYVEIIRGLLIRDINYLRSKSVFSNLRIDTESLNLDFSPALQEYFTALKYHDKESAKLIQAAGYIYSFCQFLQENTIIPDISKLVCNAVGDSDRSFNTISSTAQNLQIFQTCYQIYTKENKEEELTSARYRVLDKIKRNAYYSFQEGRKLVQSLLEITPNQINILPPHTETIPDFYNSVSPVPPELITSLNLPENCNFRQAHNQLIKRYLLSENTYIFLTGNPGIGKTTAIVDFLKQYQDEGFLLLYVSPRKQVNLDIIEKFKDKHTGKLVDDRIFAINSDSNLIKDNSGQYSVSYTSNIHKNDFTLGTVHFLNMENIQRTSKRKNRLEHISDDTFHDVGQKTKGVLNSVCEGLYHLIKSEEHHQIIATASTQSLKKTDYG
ncbi:MAG: helicase, partial [Dolichospermum sp.]